ncbi:hypothetical protein D3C71_2223100 [compost metagenome]
MGVNTNTRSEKKSTFRDSINSDASLASCCSSRISVNMFILFPVPKLAVTGWEPFSL